MAWSRAITRSRSAALGPKPAKEAVPKKYTQRTTSKLEADVDAEHTEFQFDLK